MDEAGSKIGSTESSDADRLADSRAFRDLAEAIAGEPRVAIIGPERACRVVEIALSRLRERGATAPGERQLATGPSVTASAVVVVDETLAPTLYRRTGGPKLAAEALPIEVAILGPTEIRGVEANLRGRPLLTELVVYLALHPEGALTRTWSGALWPERIVPPQTISNRLSETRHLLGLAPDDLPRLRRDGERHRLAGVTTDWARFRALADEDDEASWRSALQLVRGRPLGDLAQGQWAVMEGVVAEIESAIVDCGLSLGRACLRLGDPDGAAWAVQMALRAAPWDERLHRLLMRAADACGDRRGIESALTHLALALEIDGDPLRGVHPQTAALYTRLMALDQPQG